LRGCINPIKYNNYTIHYYDVYPLNNTSPIWCVYYAHDDDVVEGIIIIVIIYTVIAVAVDRVFYRRKRIKRLRGHRRSCGRNQCVCVCVAQQRWVNTSGPGSESRRRGGGRRVSTDILYHMHWILCTYNNNMYIHCV